MICSALLGRRLTCVDCCFVAVDEKYVPKSRRFTEIYPRWHLAEDLVTEVEREVDAVAEQQNEFKFVE